MPTYKNILVIKLGALGDFVQALGPMAAIRRHHPNAHITLMTTKAFAKFGEECSYFDDIWIDDKPRWYNPIKWLSLEKKLNNSNIDRVYDLQNNDRTSYYFRLFKRRNRPEWVGTALGASHRNRSKTRTKSHALAGHIETLALVGINDIKIDNMKWVTSDIKRFDIKEPYILMAPGSASERLEKRWSAENYAGLARHLCDKGFQPVIIGTDAEKDVTDKICHICPDAINLTGQTSIFDIIVLGRHAKAAIGNDTGPMHLIAPTGCHSLALFSCHSNPVKHAPQGEHVWTMECADLENLSVDEVISRITENDFIQTGRARTA